MLVDARYAYETVLCSFCDDDIEPGHRVYSPPTSVDDEPVLLCEECFHEAIHEESLSDSEPPISFVT